MTCFLMLFLCHLVMVSEISFVLLPCDFFLGLALIFTYPHSLSPLSLFRSKRFILTRRRFSLFFYFRTIALTWFRPPPFPRLFCASPKSSLGIFLDVGIPFFPPCFTTSPDMRVGEFFSFPPVFLLFSPDLSTSYRCTRFVFTFILFFCGRNG